KNPVRERTAKAVGYSFQIYQLLTLPFSLSAVSPPPPLCNLSKNRRRRGPRRPPFLIDGAAKATTSHRRRRSPARRRPPLLIELVFDLHTDYNLGFDDLSHLPLDEEESLLDNLALL
ncbi:hypothetical protein Dimus_007334, partial [Dionaea muscipula]